MNACCQELWSLAGLLKSCPRGTSTFSSLCENRYFQKGECTFSENLIILLNILTWQMLTILYNCFLEISNEICSHLINEVICRLLILKSVLNVTLKVLGCNQCWKGLKKYLNDKIILLNICVGLSNAPNTSRTLSCKSYNNLVKSFSNIIYILHAGEHDEPESEWMIRWDLNQALLNL